MAKKKEKHPSVRSEDCSNHRLTGLCSRRARITLPHQGQGQSKRVQGGIVGMPTMADPLTPHREVSDFIRDRHICYQFAFGICFDSKVYTIGASVNPAEVLSPRLTPASDGPSALAQVVDVKGDQTWGDRSRIYGCGRLAPPHGTGKLAAQRALPSLVTI